MRIKKGALFSQGPSFILIHFFPLAVYLISKQLTCMCICEKQQFAICSFSDKGLNGLSVNFTLAAKVSNRQHESGGI